MGKEIRLFVVDLCASFVFSVWSGVRAPSASVLDEKTGRFKGEDNFLIGLWSKAAEAAKDGVDGFAEACVKEVPNWPFLGDIFKGETLLGLRSGAGIVLTSLPNSPRLGVSLKLNRKGDTSGRLAGLDMNTESLKSMDFLGGRGKWLVSEMVFWL